MNPDISEFSYGYALTDELINWHGTRLTAAPVFPSLYQEGRTGGGYDVMLQRPGLPLFLQFKLSDCMVRKNAQEVKDGIFSTPYYRMHIRPTRHSEQHEMLLDLERTGTGNEAYYSAPAFHRPEELNDAYLRHEVRSRSLWIRPSVIGPLPDDRHHYVAFQIPGMPHFRSKPRKLDTKGDFEEFTSRVEVSYSEKGETALGKDNLNKLADSLKIITERCRDISKEYKRISDAQLKKIHPLDRIGFYAHIFMDCHLFIVREKQSYSR
jgi:hypothetical protein